MCKSELYRQILGTVSQETEIPEERILSKAKNAEIVDARYLLVYFLWRQGFHAPVISSLMNFSRRPIEKMISQFDLRRKQSGKMFGNAPRPYCVQTPSHLRLIRLLLLSFMSNFAL